MERKVSKREPFGPRMQNRRNARHGPVLFHLSYLFLQEKIPIKVGAVYNA